MSTHELGSLELLHEELGRHGFSGSLTALVDAIGRAGFIDSEWALKQLLAFLDPDPDDEVRRTAVAGLGALLKGHEGRCRAHVAHPDGGR